MASSFRTRFLVAGQPFHRMHRATIRRLARTSEKTSPTKFRELCTGEVHTDGPLPRSDRPRSSRAINMQLVEEDYYTLQDIAERLKVRYRTVYRWARAGTLPADKFGTDWRVKESDLRDSVESHRQRPD
jgi:excisionase family DNA binding protein